MRTPPLVWLALLAHVYAADDAVSVGDGNHGWEVYLTSPLRECAQLKLWYNISHVSGAPADTVLPDDGAIEFRTPNEDGDVWMTLRPPMGVGILTWTVPLKQNKQLVVKNRDGYQQSFIVGSPVGATSCGQDAAQITASSSFGEINTAAYNNLRNSNWPQVSINQNAFRPIAFPRGSFATHVVTLGSPVSAPAPGNTGSDPDNGDADQGGIKTSISGNSNTLTPENGNSNTLTPESNNSNTLTPESSNGSAASLSSSSNDPSNTRSVAPSQSEPKEVDVAPGATETVTIHDNVDSHIKPNILAIVAGVVGALLAGSIIGALLVWLHRRTRRRSRQAVPLGDRLMSPVMETNSLASAAGAFSSPVGAFVSDRKNRAAFVDDHRVSSILGRESSNGTVMWNEERRQSFFGGWSDFPASTEASSDAATSVSGAPPRYSRLA